MSIVRKCVPCLDGWSMTESQKAKGLTREMQRDRFGCVEQRGSDGKGALKRDRLEGRTKRMLTHRLQDKPWMKYVSTGILLASASLWAACSSDEGSVDKRSEVTNEDGDAPLSNLDDLTAGAPSKADLPEEGKADAVYPPTYFDLVKLQSPVKSQGSRGVCSIFASTAHMEHLYIAEGTIKTPDFSEQFLQWSVKNEVKAFRNTEGSSASENLRAIYQFGIVEEAAWPYESTKWSSYNHPECSGEDSLPTECYTNAIRLRQPWERSVGASLKGVGSIRTSAASRRICSAKRRRSRWGGRFTTRRGITVVLRCPPTMPTGERVMLPIPMMSINKRAWKNEQDTGFCSSVGMIPSRCRSEMEMASC